MPEKKERKLSAVGTVLKNVASIRREVIRAVREKQRELTALQHDLARLSFGNLRKIKTATEIRRAQPTDSPKQRIDWSVVLADLPITFTATDVKKASGKERPSEIFAAVTRWIKNGNVRRKERGIYERKLKAPGRRGRPVKVLKTGSKRRNAAQQANGRDIAAQA